MQKWWFLGLVLLAVQVGLLFYLGQPLVCECGVIKFFESVILSPGNSQQIADWYTFSHLIHGFIFFGLLSLLFPKQPIGLRLLIAMTVEISWEIFENTPMVIEAYRAQALAQGYNGDSILNSISDTIAMVIGFAAAYKLPLKISIAAVIGMELLTGYLVRDNLTLNILNFVYPLESVHHWQSQK